MEDTNKITGSPSFRSSVLPGGRSSKRGAVRRKGNTSHQFCIEASRPEVERGTLFKREREKPSFTRTKHHVANNEGGKNKKGVFHRARYEESSTTCQLSLSRVSIIEPLSSARIVDSGK